MQLKKLLQLVLFLIPSLAFAQTATINGGNVYQTIDGFGGQNGGPWSWASSPYNWNAMGSGTATALFSPTSGIGVSIYRSDNQDGTSSTLPPDMSSMEQAYALGAKIQLTLQSPPSSMKSSGQWGYGPIGGGGSCLSASDSTYATYIVQLIQNIQSAGSLTVSWVALQNEPSVTGTSGSGANGGFGSCAWTEAALDTMTQALGSALTSAGLSTKILLAEQFDYANSPNYFGTCLGDGSCAPYIGVITGHGYGYPDTPVAPGSGGYPVISAYHMWMGETCPNGDSSFDSSMTSALPMAENIDSFLSTGEVSAYQWWELGYFTATSPTSGAAPDCNLIGSDPSSGALTYTKRYYAFGNYSKFIRPGQVEIGATHAPQSGVTVTAFKNASSGAFEIVAVNSNSGSVSQPFTLSSLTASSVTPYITDASNNLAVQSAITVASSSFTSTLTGNSVTTFVSSTGGGSGNCPSGANYINPANPTGAKVTLSSLGVSSCYYVSAAGSDTNSGTSESSPWAHAPFMPAATGVPAALATSLSGTAAAGLGFIFRGGDSWHFGNSGASPYTGGTWEFNTGTLWSGTSSNPIYFGVDPTWFTGASWARPILTADNPLCGPGTVGGGCNAYTANYWQQYYVNSCPYQIAGGSNMLDVSWISYYVFDSFEMTGICLNTPGQPYSSDSYISYGDPHGQHLFENLYIHGWTHTAFAGYNGGPACTSGVVCTNTYAFIGTPLDDTTTPSDRLLFDVVDGADSDPVAGSLCYAPFYDVEYSVFRYTSQCITRQLHTFHDNLYEYFFEDGHSNVLENAVEWNGTNAVYNNVFRDLETVGGTNGVGIWLSPDAGNADYYFNNVMYDEGQMEIFNIGNTINPSTNTGTYALFNNTFDFTAGSGNAIPCNSYATSPVVMVNNHFITETTPFTTGCTGIGSGPFTPNLTMNHATAAAAGYNTSQTYADSPTSSSSPTVGAGTNEQSICTALGITSCASDTAYGVVYNAATHTASAPGRTVTGRPASGAWDVGGYQYNGAPPPAAPVASVSPSTLPFGNVALTATGGPLTVTLSNTGNASLIIASIISSSGEFTKASDQCQTTFSYSLPQGQSCTVTVTFTPNALGAQNGTLTFTDNSSNVSGSQQTVALTGTGTSPGLWTSASSTTNFTVSWSSGTTQSCAVTKTLTASQPALLAYWGWAQGAAPTVNGVSGDSFTNAIFAPPQPPPGGGKYMISGIAEEPSATGGSTTATITLNTPSPIVGNLDCDLVQPIIATGTAILDGVASVGYQGCTVAVPCVSPTVALSGNDYVIVVGAKGNPAPTAPAAPWTTPADIDTGTNQYGGAFGALNQSVYSGFTFGGVSSTDYESISALSFGQSAALTVAVSPSGSGTLSCSSGNYPNGKAITCVATPGSGYGTPTWSGVSGCSGVSCTFNMNGPTSVTAVFPAVTYTLTQVISPVSSGYVAGPNCNTGSYTSGTTIGPCTATPAASYAFAGWSGGGCSGTSTCTVASLSANTTLTATFTPTGGGSYTWTPTISPVASGTLAGTHCAAGTYTSGTTIGACTATPATGYAFDDWSSVSGSAGCSGATNPCASFVISANSAATANFTQTSYTLGATTSGTGSGTATPSSTSLHYGDAYTITVTPASGSVVDSVTGCGVSSQSPYTGTMPAATCSVQVVFDVESFSWTPLILPPGSGSITGTNSVGGTYVSGTDIGALTPTPSTGYIFSSWTAVTGSADCSGSTTPCVQFALDANSTATANFTPVNSTISVSIPGGGGTVTGCAGSHAYGSIYSCAATPAANYYLQSISGCGGSGGTTYSGATPATDCNIIATFGVAQTGSTSSQTLEAQ